ncbi:hypothetical protein ASD86_12855 [Lysobacter sp. Root690]|nr:hypothetical protein ASD86_12855 [Lysobacter sp. Root690]
MTDSPLASRGFQQIVNAIDAPILAPIAAQPEVADNRDSDAGTRELLQHPWCRDLVARLCESLRAAHGEVECTARPGDLLIMRPLLLHASSKAVQPSGRRRILHFLFGPRDPGFGLRWSLAI